MLLLLLVVAEHDSVFSNCDVPLRIGEQQQTKAIVTLPLAAVTAVDTCTRCRTGASSIFSSETVQRVAELLLPQHYSDQRRMRGVVDSLETTE
jgi:hypothetical protein